MQNDVPDHFLYKSKKTNHFISLQANHVNSKVIQNPCFFKRWHAPRAWSSLKSNEDLSTGLLQRWNLLSMLFKILFKIIHVVRVKVIIIQNSLPWPNFIELLSWKYCLAIFSAKQNWAENHLVAIHYMTITWLVTTELWKCHPTIIIFMYLILCCLIDFQLWPGYQSRSIMLKAWWRYHRSVVLANYK